MNFLFAIFFGAGVAAVVYGRMGRRLGYSNQQNLSLIVGIAFVIAAVFFYTILAFFIKPH